MSSKTLITIAYGDYWERYGERFHTQCEALLEKPDEIIIVTDKPINTPYKNIVYVPEGGINEYSIGSYRQRGLDECKTEWMINIDIDDIMYSNYVSDLKEDVDMHLFTVKNNEMTMNNFENVITNFKSLKYISLGGFMNSAYKTEMLRRIGGYKVDFGWEDQILKGDIINSGASYYVDKTLRGERVLTTERSITKTQDEIRTRKYNETLEYFKSQIQRA